MTSSFSLLLTLLAAGTYSENSATHGSPESAPIQNCDNEEARSFDFWIGSWTASVWTRKFGDQASFDLSAVLSSEVTAELDGCVIVERVELKPVNASAGSISAGYSARFYDPANGVWRAILLWPSQNASKPYEMIGRFQLGRAEFYRTVPRPDSKPLLARFTFSDIGEHTFRWDSAVASETWAPVDFEQGLASVWFTESKFEFQRVLRHDEPPLQARVCADDVQREISGLTGNWSNEDRSQELRVSSTAGGCAAEIWFGSRDKHYAYALVAHNSVNSNWQSFVFTPGLIHRESMETIADSTLKFETPGGSLFSYRFDNDRNAIIFQNGQSSTKLTREVAR